MLNIFGIFIYASNSFIVHIDLKKKKKKKKKKKSNI